MGLRYINGVPNAPQAVGPYSQAVIIDNLVYLSGQIPIDPKTGQLVEGSFEEQVNQVMKNILAVLGFMQMDFANVIKSTIFLTDLNNFQTLNLVYSKWLCGVKPARSTVEVSKLPLGANVEIEMIACLELKDAPHLPHGHIEDLEKMKQSSLTCSSKEN